MIKKIRLWIRGLFLPDPNWRNFLLDSPAKCYLEVENGLVLCIEHTSRYWESSIFLPYFDIYLSNIDKFKFNGHSFDEYKSAQRWLEKWYKKNKIAILNYFIKKLKNE